VGEIGKTLVTEGEHRLELQVVGETDKERYRLANMQFAGEYQRKDSILTNPMTYQVIAITILAIIAVLIISYIYQHTSPVRGVLAFYRPGGSSPFYIHRLGRRHQRKVSHKFAGEPDVSKVLWHIRDIEARMAGKEEVSVTFNYQDSDPDEKVLQAQQDTAQTPSVNEQAAMESSATETQQGVDPAEDSAKDNHLVRLNGPIYVQYEI